MGLNIMKEMGLAQVLESKKSRRKTWVIGYLDESGNIYKSLKSIDPLSLKVEWVERPQVAWNCHDRNEVQKVLGYLLEYKIVK